MNVYEVQVRWADWFRNHQLTPLARLFYFLALRIGGDQDGHCRHMMAVCYTTEHRGKKADKWFARALEGANNYETANIFRDWGKRYILAKQYSVAIYFIEQALELLPRNKYPAAHAQTLGFLGQVCARSGEHLDAEFRFLRADIILCTEEDRRPCLFNQVHRAKNLLKMGEYGLAGEVAESANMLASELKLWPYRIKTRLLMIRAELKEAQEIDI